MHGPISYNFILVRATTRGPAGVLGTAPALNIEKKSRKHKIGLEMTSEPGSNDLLFNMSAVIAKIRLQKKGDY